MRGRTPIGEFGTQAGEGRRQIIHSRMPLPVMLSAVGLACCAERLRGDTLPSAMDDVEIEIQRITAFATVMWSRGNECEIRFAQPLSRFDVERLRHAASLAKYSKLAVEEWGMLEDWNIGLAR